MAARRGGQHPYQGNQHLIGRKGLQLVAARRGGQHPHQRFLPDLGSIRYNEKRNAATTSTMETQTPSQGVRAMSNLPLNAYADRHSRAMGNLKKAHPGHIHLLVDAHTISPTVTIHQQATSTEFSIAKCIKRATSHNNTGSTSIRSRQSCTSHASSTTMSIPWPV